MSAWIVAKDHIDVMVGLAMMGGHDGVVVRDPDRPGEDHWGHIVEYDARPGRSEVSADRVGFHLWRENHYSVDARYSETNQMESYTFGNGLLGNVVGRLNMLPRDQLVRIGVKAISCYTYQSCEHDLWTASWSHEFCNRLMSHVAHMLPGLDDAPGWGIDSLDDICPPSNVRRLI